MTKKKKIVVICPGRGSYTKDSLGYLKNRPFLKQRLDEIDQLRKELSLIPVTDLDGASQFKTQVHTKGEQASVLIYTCSLSDFLEINTDSCEILAVTGNSMGWYSALAFSGVLDSRDCFDLIQTMGMMTANLSTGGQVIYPVVNDNWKLDEKALELFEKSFQKSGESQDSKLYLSVELGGYKLVAGHQKALNLFLKTLPEKDHYPFQLINHSAFHSPLMSEVSKEAFKKLSHLGFRIPEIPLIDGRGHIWRGYSTDPEKLCSYTLGEQVVSTYDFSKAVEVALKEFAPDHLVLLGPGNTLGGAIGQILVQTQWRGITDKNQFKEKQKKSPFLLSMALEEQKNQLIK